MVWRQLRVAVGLAALIMVLGSVPVDGAMSEDTVTTNVGPIPDACGDRIPHPPIQITTDAGPQGFVLVEGTPTYRPGSGVLDGSGTEQDPYLIEDWCIFQRDLLPQELQPVVEPNQQDRGIEIKDTTAHVVVRNTVILGYPETGILLERADNVTLEENLVTGNTAGIDISESDGLLVEANQVTDNVQGLGVSEAEGATIVANTATGNDRDGIEVARSPDAVIRGNNASDNRFQGLVVVGGSPGSVVLENEATGNTDGISVFSDDVIVRQNHVEENGGAGIEIVGAEDDVVQGNTVADNGRGIEIDRGSRQTGIVENTVSGNDVGIRLVTHGFFLPADDTRVRANAVLANGVGVVVDGSVVDTRLRDNNIHSNVDGIGVDATGADDPVDAVENWWGCPDGPDDAACDDVIGEATYDPWLTAPNTDAGAG